MLYGALFVLGFGMMKVALLRTVWVRELSSLQGFSELYYG